MNRRKYYSNTFKIEILKKAFELTYDKDFKDKYGVITDLEMEYGVNYQTLSSWIKRKKRSGLRIKEFPPRGRPKYFLANEEELLGNWLMEMMVQSIPISMRNIRKKISEISNGKYPPDNKTKGRFWITNLLKILGILS